MPIFVNCSHCKKPLRVPEFAAGRPIQCPHCHQLSQAPDISQPAERAARTSLSADDVSQGPAQFRPPPGPWPGIVSMITGIVGALAACLPFASIPISLVAIVFGGIGIARIRGRRMAIAGLALGIVGFLLTLVVGVIWWFDVFNLSNARISS